MIFPCRLVGGGPGLLPFPPFSFGDGGRGNGGGDEEEGDGEDEDEDEDEDEVEDEVGRGAARVHAGGFTVRTETLGVGRGSVPDDHFVEQGNILSGTRACYRLPLCRSLSPSLSMRHRVVVVG